MPCLPLCDAGHVSGARRLIDHSNCEWRGRTAEGLCKATFNPPFPHYTLSNLCQRRSLSGEWRPCVLRLQMGYKEACPRGKGKEIKISEKIFDLVPTSKKIDLFAKTHANADI